MKRHRQSRAILLAAAIAGTFLVSPFPGAEGEQQPTAQETASHANPSRFLPYEQVITKGAHTKRSFFTFHWTQKRIFLEIPDDQLGKIFLWGAHEITGHSTGRTVHFVGTHRHTRVVRWVRDKDKLLLRQIPHDQQRGGKLMLSCAEEGTFMIFDIQTISPANSPLVEATALFLNEARYLYSMITPPGRPTLRTWQVGKVLSTRDWIKVQIDYQPGPNLEFRIFQVENDPQLDSCQSIPE